MVRNEISGWMGTNYEKLHIVTTYNLLYNASLMVEEGMGYALCLDKIVRTSEEGPLVGLDMVWKKHQVFSKAAAEFLDHLQKAWKL